MKINIYWESGYMSKEKIDSISRRLFNQLMGLLNLTEDIWLLGGLSQEEMLGRLKEYHTDVVMTTDAFVLYGIIAPSIQNRTIGDTMLTIQNSSMMINKDTFIELKAILVGLKAAMNENMEEC